MERRPHLGSRCTGRKDIKKAHNYTKRLVREGFPEREEEDNVDKNKG